MSNIALRNLVVRQLYGRDFEGVAIEGLGDGLTVVYGPNGSGKSTLARASSMLFNSHKKNVKRSDRIRAEITVNGDSKRVELDGPHDDPFWPQSPRVGLYRLSIADIITGPAEEDTARVRDALAGGISLARLKPPTAGRPPRDPLIRAARKLQDARTRAEELHRSESLLELERHKLHEATAAQNDLAVIDAWLNAAQIEAEAAQLSNEIAQLDQQQPGIEFQSENAADDAEVHLVELQAARRESIVKRRAIRECTRKRARHILDGADRQALKRLKDQAKELDGQTTSGRQHCRECIAAVSDAKRELQRIRPDQRRASGKLDAAVLQSRVKELSDAHQLLAAAEVEFARAVQMLGDAKNAFQLAGGNPQQHPTTAGSADQIQSLPDLDAAISDCRNAVDDVQHRADDAEQEVQHRLAAFDGLTVPPRQVLDEALREPSIARLQDDLRECQMKQQAYMGAADSLSSSGQRTGNDSSLQQAIDGFRDWMRAIPDSAHRAVPAVLIIACFAVAAAALLVSFFAPAVVAGVVASSALVVVGVALLLLRRRPKAVDTCAIASIAFAASISAYTSVMEIEW